MGLWDRWNGILGVAGKGPISKDLEAGLSTVGGSGLGGVV